MRQLAAGLVIGAALGALVGFAAGQCDPSVR
jgi:hypothetical protein